MKPRVRSIVPGSPDDLLICSTSFEPRCCHVPSCLPPSGYSCKRSLIVQFAGADPRKTANLVSLKEYLSQVSESDSAVETCLCDIDRPDEIVRFLRRHCATGLRYATIDITTLTKKYLLVILKVLRGLSPESTVRLLYTPGKYGRNEPLSWGVKQIGIVPFLGGMSCAESSKSLLVLFLGYEKERAWSIWRRAEADKTVAVLTVPATHPGDDLPARSAHREILAHEDTRTEYVSALGAADSERLLTELYRDEAHDGFMFFIAPLGTKVQTAGIYRFFEINQPTRAQVIYASPVVYNRLKYTVGYDEQIVEYVLPPLGGDPS